MVAIDFYVAVAVYLLGNLILMMVVWLWGKKQKEKHLYLNPKCQWYCNVCTYTYINTREERISVCPRCGSYNKKSLT